jgi:hypothetical protein
MSYIDLLNHFSNVELLPIPIDDIIDWIRQNTEHENIKLHAVSRENKAFRGAFRRTAMPSLRAYDSNPEVLNCVIFGKDLPEDWQRLVITKELLHIFDNENESVKTKADVEALIPAIIFSDIRQLQAAPILNDKIGPLKAMRILMPDAARNKLEKAFSEGRRTSADIAHYVKLPLPYVELWLTRGESISKLL